MKEEFKRITTINLDRTFLTKMDFYTPKLLTVFKTKGGTSGTKIKSVLESLNQVGTVHCTSFMKGGVL